MKWKNPPPKKDPDLFPRDKCTHAPTLQIGEKWREIQNEFCPIKQVVSRSPARKCLLFSCLIGNAAEGPPGVHFERYDFIACLENGGKIQTSRQNCMHTIDKD